MTSTDEPTTQNEIIQIQNNDTSKDDKNEEKAAPNSPVEHVPELQNTPEPPHSIFTPFEKWLIVIMAGLASIFSPLTSTIYLPAIPTIAIAFNKSIELINLTVTAYMILQGISPTVWGTLADWYGRRPVFVACLFVLTATCAGIAVLPTSAYWALVLLRCLQAAGSASTVAVGAGVIVDISTRDERGTFLGLMTLGTTVGPCIGPVIGGVLADKLGWRSIFWFLTISSGVCCVFMLLFLPETLRYMVGNGGIPPPKWNRPLLPIIGRKRLNDSPDTAINLPAKKPLANPIRIVANLDVLCLLVFNGFVTGLFYIVSTTISIVFEDSYPFLNQTDIGLCFLAIGGGMVVGSITSGKVLDRTYAHAKRQLETKALQERYLEEKRRGETRDRRQDGNLLKEEDFPIERTRLMIMPYYIVILVASCVAYGWLLEKKVQLAGPLVFQIIIGYSTMGIINTTQVLLMDLFPSHGSSVTAANNLIRCTSGAALVSVIEIIIRALGVGWTFVLFAGITLLLSPLLYVVLRIGPSWRERRRLRESKN